MFRLKNDLLMGLRLRGWVLGLWVRWWWLWWRVG